MACILDGSKLTLSGTVGEDYWDGFTYSDVVLALAAIDDAAPLTVHVNSGGGIATEGSAIHSLLSGRAGRTDIVVEGIAASAASLIAMAGASVKMADGAILMIHDPAGLTVGTSADHQKQIEALEALATSYARVYAAKSGKTAEECREIMRAERWYGSDEAIAEGFADARIERQAAPVAKFNYMNYARAPEPLRASAQNWLDANPPAARSAAPAQKEPTMSDKNQADAKPAAQPDLDAARAEAVQADRARRTAIMALPEAKGREALADHLYSSTDMAVDVVKAALAAAPTAAEPAPAPAPEAANLATAGLGGQPDKRATMRVDIVATARERAGQKG